MAAKPNIPVTRKEMYLDVMTGGSSSLPAPVTIVEKYLAKIAGMTVDLPAPVPLKHKFLAKIAGMQVDVPTYTTGLPRIYAYLAKAAGQDVEVPQPITREEMYWFDYVCGQPAPPEREYTGAVPVTFPANGQPLLDYLISGSTVQSGTPSHDSPIMPEGCGDLETIGEKAGQYKIPILSAGQTTPVYLGEVETTRYVRKLVLDGTEDWKKRAYNDAIHTFEFGWGPRLIRGLCSHYAGYLSASIDKVDGIYLSNTTVIIITDLRFTTPTDFKAFLAAQYAAGTPVTVWYVLATPETAVVNEPLMKIGDYVDTLSMEQAGVEIPTVNGENTLDVLTTVKPSEVYIKYKGEPVAGSQTSSQSSAYAPAEVSGQSENIDDIKEEETE